METWSGVYGILLRDWSGQFLLLDKQPPELYYTHTSNNIMFAHLTRKTAHNLANKRMASTFSSPRPSSLKGVLFGFFAGVSLTGFGCYYYLLDEYKTSSNAIISDILLLQKTIRNMETHIRTLESSIEKK